MIFNSSVLTILLEISGNAVTYGKPNDNYLTEGQFEKGRE